MWKNKCLKKIDAITELLRPAFSALCISIFVCFIKNNFVSKLTHPLVVTNSCRLSSNKINCGKTHQNNMNINGCVLQCQLWLHKTAFAYSKLPFTSRRKKNNTYVDHVINWISMQLLNRADYVHLSLINDRTAKLFPHNILCTHNANIRAITYVIPNICKGYSKFHFHFWLRHNGNHGLSVRNYMYVLS